MPMLRHPYFFWYLAFVGELHVLEWLFFSHFHNLFTYTNGRLFSPSAVLFLGRSLGLQEKASIPLLAFLSCVGEWRDRLLAFLLYMLWWLYVFDCFCMFCRPELLSSHQAVAKSWYFQSTCSKEVGCDPMRSHGFLTAALLHADANVCLRTSCMRHLWCMCDCVYHNNFSRRAAIFLKAR